MNIENVFLLIIGMNLKDYQDYCQKLKVPKKINNIELEKEDRTLELMKYLGIDEDKLKKKIVTD